MLLCKMNHFLNNLVTKACIKMILYIFIFCFPTGELQPILEVDILCKVHCEIQAIDKRNQDCSERKFGGAFCVD